MAQVVLNQASERWVQSCITNINFPQSLDGVRGLVEKNRYRRDGATDLDALLEFDPSTSVMYWTAPKWIMQGDILFLYHAVMARKYVRHLLRLARKEHPVDAELVATLGHAADLAERYSGKLFGYAEVAGATEHLSDDDDDLMHFRSRVYAPLGKVHIFQHPLSLDVLETTVKISRGGAITPVSAHEFDAVKALLARDNTLPESMARACGGDLGFRAVNQSNWPEIACRSSVAFLHEAQLRAYLLDYFLAELKDSGTPLLQECRCFRDQQQTGFADYFIKVHGRWVPVEAKLNMLAEQDILGQVSKYQHVQSFTPTKGVSKGERFQTSDDALCLVADMSGVYVVQDHSFIDCTPGAPTWRRAHLGHVVVNAMRERLRSYMGQ